MAGRQRERRVHPQEPRAARRRRLSEPCHGEFIEVGADDAEKPDALEQRVPCIARFIEHAPLEFQQALVGIEQQRGIVQAHSFERGWRDGVQRCPHDRVQM